MAARERLAKAIGPIKREKPAPTQQNLTAKDVPDGLSVEQTLEWVSGDKRRASAALKAEEKSSSPRTSLVHSLQRIANVETGAGLQTGEA